MAAVSRLLHCAVVESGEGSTNEGGERRRERAVQSTAARASTPHRRRRFQDASRNCVLMDQLTAVVIL